MIIKGEGLDMGHGLAFWAGGPGLLKKCRPPWLGDEKIFRFYKLLKRL